MAVRSSSFSSFNYAFSYDVFLSFRGIDTRYGFTGNLCRSLRDQGIHTFFDDDELQRGDEIKPALLKAIEGSRIAIPIFSINYASSSFTLDELVHIVECVKANGRLVLPIFYDVDPSHVRHQRGSYEETMAKHEDVKLQRIQKWKMALNEVVNLSGYHFKQGDGYEHMFIRKIVEEVSRKINRLPLPVADYPVGLESQVLEVKSLLDAGSNDSVVHVIGIHGIGGIGKTTLALAVYNFIADHFEGSCFLENVRETSSKHGLTHLQKILLSEILGEKNIELASVRQGIAIMQHRLQRKKILLILDDVDKLEQLHAFVGRPNWFGPGSTIIITTRDTHLLKCQEIEKTYEVKELERGDALQLLGREAFRSVDKVCQSYWDILNQVATYACGLPLALKVIGSNLFGKSVEKWKSTLDQYRRIPNKEIQRILKVSFDALEEEEQSVFLDIACFFKGYSLKEVENILCAHYSNCMKYQISVLVEKSLIKIDRYGLIALHDLIEEMGKEIVRQESPKEAGERSRLWFSKDIVQVLEENSGTSKIEIIIFKNSFFGEEEVIEWNGEAFKKMTKLKTLIIRRGHFSTGPTDLPNSLRVLEWWRYPSHNLPSVFHPEKLVMLELPYNWFTSFELNNKLKKFVNMKVLNLNECQHLTHIGDVSSLSSLEELTFIFCQNLITIHSSVGFLDKLKVLKAGCCTSLRSFPPMKLTSLERLDFKYCSNLEAFPEIVGKMENITDLNFEGCHSLKELPFSIVNLTGLYRLVAGGRRLRLPSSIGMMPKLTVFQARGMNKLPEQAECGKNWIEILCLCYCQFSKISLSSLVTCFANVKELNLSESDFTIIPESVKGYHSLRTLIVDGCKRLQQIRGIPPKIEIFSARNCHSLTCSSRSMLLNQELHETRNTEFCLPGVSIPNWFEHQKLQCPISFWFRNKSFPIVLCIVSQRRIYGVEMKIIVGNNGHAVPLFFRRVAPDKDHMCLLNLENKIVMPGNNEWKHAIIEVSHENCIKEIAIHVTETKDICFADPYRKRKFDDDPESGHHLLKKSKINRRGIVELAGEVNHLALKMQDLIIRSL